MNRYILSSLLAISAAVSSTAFADDITVDTTPFTSTKSRAEVQAELSQYQRAGVNPWAQDHNPLADFRSTRTRAQVTAEYIADRDQVEAMTREDSGSSYLAQRTPAIAPVFAGQPTRAY
jgi:hypothetical protein